MKKSKSWETLTWVLIIAVIIIIVMFSISKIVEYDSNLDFEYNKINYLNLLKSNTSKIVSKIDLSDFWENDEVYLYKTWSKINAFSWTINSDFKYINYMWEWVNSNYDWVIYSRICLVSKDSDEGQMIKCSLKEMIKK